MDGLDVYIDDYSKPDPIPDAMLQQLERRRARSAVRRRRRSRSEQKQRGGRRGARRGDRAAEAPAVPAAAELPRDRCRTDRSTPSNRSPSTCTASPKPVLTDLHPMALDGQDAEGLQLQPHHGARRARRWRAALRVGRADRDPTELCRKRGRRRSRPRSPAAASASSPARRKRRSSPSSHESSGAKGDAASSSTSARWPAGRPRAAAATPKIAALLALAELPEPGAGAERVVPVGRAAARHRSGRGRGAVGRAARGRARGERRSSPSSTRRRSARWSARYPGLVGAGRRRSRASSARSRSSGSRRTRSTSTSARAATRASAPVPRARDRLQLPGRPRPVQGAPRVREGLRRRCGAIDFERADRARSERFDLVLDLSPEPLIKAAAQAAGLFRAGPRPARAGARRSGARAAGRRVREAEVLRLQRTDLRARPLGQGRLHEVHRRLLDRRDLVRPATRSRSSRTSAWAAAAARPCARRAR